MSNSTYERSKVLVFGTFDIVHPGHINFFKQAKKYGDHLTAVVARDETVKKVKGSKPKYPEQDRLEYLKELCVVDEVMLGSKGDVYDVLSKVKPDVVCLGYDQKAFTDRLKEELEKRNIGAEIVRLKPYKPGKYKSSKLKGYNIHAPTITQRNS